MKLRDYPFLVSLRDYSRRVAGVELSASELARDAYLAEASLARLKAALEGGEPPRALTVDDEVYTFHLAAALAAALGPVVLKNYAEYEASRSRNALRMEDERGLLEVASLAGLRAQKNPVSLPWLVSRDGTARRRVLPYRVHVRDFLETVAGDGSEGELTNSFLKDGWVYLDRAMLEDLVYRAFKKIIAARAEEDRVEDLPDELVAKARVVAENALARRSGRLAPLDEGKLPPCIARIARKASEAGLESLDDKEGYMLATFLSTLDADLDVLARLLGVGEREAMGLLSLARFARARGYRTYTCRAARELGLCEWDCRGPTPVAEYLRRLGRSSAGAPVREGRGASQA